MLDHLGIQVRDPAVSAAFYDAVLAPLGGKRMQQYGDVIGYGVDHPDFWISPIDSTGNAREAHIAFVAPSRAAVQAFHDAALKLGAEVLHLPKLWPEYHPTYFGVFIRDPDGHNVEAVCHAPE
ncbi:VOC family protein [Micromonospora sp. NPDC000089]|uniref:VOC family protein n=1 Tax=unclassified Micromonospora TaxID=2617518 RepID=UPI0036A856BB